LCCIQNSANYQRIDTAEIASSLQTRCVETILRCVSRIRDQASYVEVQHTRIVDIFAHVLHDFLVKFALTALMQVKITQGLQEFNDFIFIGRFGSFCNVIREAVKRVIL
jgi:hypothetical protein